MVDRQGYADALLVFGDWPYSAEKVLAIVSWATAEGSDALNNPLDTTEAAPGAWDYNRAGVKNYPSLQVGLEAVYATLHNGRYGGILACLADPSGSSAMALAAAVGASPWGTGNFSKVVEIVRADPAPYYGHPVAGSGVSPPDVPPAPLPQSREVKVLIVESSDGRSWLVSGNTKVYIPDPPDGSALADAGLPVVKLSAAFVNSIPTAA